MKPRILIDTGPIVALLSERDQHHQRCLAELANHRPPLFTCWPVVTEAHWLLRADHKAVKGLFRAFDTRLLSLLTLGEEAMPWLAAFMHRYRNIEADLADAALLFLADREGIDTIFTLDQRDFSIYRGPRRQALKIVPPAW